MVQVMSGPWFGSCSVTEFGSWFGSWFGSCSVTEFEMGEYTVLIHVLGVGIYSRAFN